MMESLTTAAGISILLGDIFVLLFDLLIYMNLTKFKHENKHTRTIAYAGCSVILCAYFVSSYILGLPAVIASFFCMTLPSIILFWSLSKYKGARFFVTFCFVDTVTLAIAFFARAISQIAGSVGGSISCVVLAVLLLLIYIKARPYFSHYRALLESVRDGWNTIMLATIFIYVLMMFAAAYPKPLVQRPEYLAVYMVLCLTVLSFYLVFISTLIQKKRLYDLNEQLIQEKKWYKIAYEDALTGVRNRMAYIERINELECIDCKDSAIHGLLIDIDDFKQINDTFGHHAGDAALKEVAHFLSGVFQGDGYELFRIGGDEFAVISIGVTEEALLEKMNRVTRLDLGGGINCAFSLGHSLVNFDEHNALEKAFIRADAAMYADKAKKKGT